jgi:hypothetical protein
MQASVARTPNATTADATFDAMGTVPASPHSFFQFSVDIYDSDLENDLTDFLLLRR